MSNNNVVLSGLARRLVREGVVDEEAAKGAVASAQSEGKPLPVHLTEKGVASGAQICALASDEFGTPVFDLSTILPESLPQKLVDSKLVSKHHALPLYKRGNRLFVALSDPTNLHALDEIKFNTGLTTEAILVEADKLSQAIEAYLNAAEESIGEALGGLDEEALDGLDVESVENDKQEVDEGSEVDEAPIVRFVNKVLLDAIKMGASDIHFEPYEKTYRGQVPRRWHIARNG